MRFVKFLVVLLGVCVAVAAFVFPLVRNIAAVASRREVSVNSQTIIAEVAATPEAMQRGLGRRDRIGVNEGMLFPFATPGVYPFWMKDMRFPIDIVWIRDSRIVGITERIDPQIGAPDNELKLYSPPEPVTDVLEVASGRAGLLWAVSGTPVTVRPLLGGE